MTAYTCDICKTTSSELEEATLIFGEWMHRGNLSVHYNCLLLSTHLPQNGEDTSGILGFLVRDIRKEIAAAERRACSYCKRNHASIKCHQCQIYFHLECGNQNGCLFQFTDDFRSYCDECYPLDEHQRKTLDSPPDVWICAICQSSLSGFKHWNWIHGNCCGKGWVHRRCIQKYALSAGYYLRCIWCRDPKFREMMRKLGIFVPDRDASWERQKYAYSDLHRGHERCDIEPCVCPKGRDYKTTNSGWRFLTCQSCGSFGAHYTCLGAKAKRKLEEFNCDVCQQVQAENNNPREDNDNDKINHSVYMKKTNAQNVEICESETPTFSMTEESESQQLTTTSICNISNNVANDFVDSQTSCAVQTEGTLTQNVDIISDSMVENEANGDVVCAGNRYHVFDAWTLLNNVCTGCVTICIDRLDTRFAGLSTTEIENSMQLDLNTDVISSTPDRGIFDIIDDIIANNEY